MTDPYFTTPAGVQDYTNEANYAKWSKCIGDFMNKTLASEEEIVGKGKSQFYNPETNPAGSGKANVVVSWNGFPRRLRFQYPDNYLEIADKKDGWPYNGRPEARNQDEYLEWFVHKNAQGKITRIDFTCEGPEYWTELFEWEPSTCLKLYQAHVSPDVEMADLTAKKDEGKDEYNVYNKWNTTHGCMHLNCPPNSLDAEIKLAGDASIIRKDSNGFIITDSQKLINCAKFGRADRNSDPQIGSACNTLCRKGMRITVGNPVCLFIVDVMTSGWTTPDGSDAAQYMKLVRGTKEFGLRYTLEVPKSKNFTVGDIKIGGDPIQYGGTVAFLINIGLLAEACPNETGVQPAHECVSDDTFAAITLKLARLAGKKCVPHRAHDATFASCKC